MSAVADNVWQGIENSLMMAYEVWWALVLGFAIATVVFATLTLLAVRAPDRHHHHH